MQRCNFPEFRCLFRAVEMYPWAEVSKMEDTKYADLVVTKCQDQIMRVFPIIDVLNCGGSLPAMLNPLNYIRWLKRFSASKCTPIPEPLRLIHPNNNTTLASLAQQ